MIDSVILAGPSSGRRLAGMSVLRRLILSAKAAGVRRILVLGAVVDQARQALTNDDMVGVSIVAQAAASDLQALAGGPHVLLLHTELAVDPGYLEGLTATAIALESDGALFAVGKGPPPRDSVWFGIEIQDGKVSVRETGGALHVLGAAILPISVLPDVGSAHDVGALLRQHLEQASAAGLYRPGRGYAALFPAGAAPGPVEWALIRSVGKESDGFVSRSINRRCSALVTALLINTRVTPNAITFALLGLGLATGAVLLSASHVAFIAGALLFQLNSALDGCDGEIARLKFQTSRFGAWADNVCDQIVNLSFFAAAPLGLYFRTGERLHLWLALFIIVGVLTLIPVVYLRSKRAGSEEDFSDFGQSVARGLQPGSWRAKVAATLARLLRRDSYVLLFLILALAGADRLVVYLLAAGVAVHYLGLLLPTSKPSPDQLHAVG